ncbi:Polyvinylalcohol dehydrogenase [Tetrabaena socialis]|uniref:Polyvinylalcohol dehydrogenase n=1 Tax=Tetrabaena socialis TaxID=47790 RepID=A0A2J7ZWP3_9CHLO|nr:Polyvinylalcohol dehydrogenase [Tetrabaena socialis]|eukprot:PNH04693.1 Polyvinylalcohol dehydrogenase [Tetrabaena socialis]
MRFQLALLALIVGGAVARAQFSGGRHCGRPPPRGRTSSTVAWPSWAGNNMNWRAAVVSKAVSSAPTLKYTYDTGGSDVSCTPTVVDGAAYFGDWGGYLYKVNTSTGALIWKLKASTVNDLVGPTPGHTEVLITRNSPTHAPGGILLFGTQVKTAPGPATGSQAWLVAIKASDGNPLWRHDCSDGNSYAVLTASPTVHKGGVYVGISSIEELVAILGGCLKYTYDTGGSDVSCTPTVVDGAAYFGDWGGYLYKVNTSTGALIWKLKASTVNDLVGPTPGHTEVLITRNSPTHAPGGILLFGTQVKTAPGPATGSQAWLVAIKASDGNPLWRHDCSDGNSYAVLTASPTVHKGGVYVGISSIEELVAILGGDCCKFRGSVKKISLATGMRQWEFFTVPDNGNTTTGFSGVAVWGSQISVDAERGLVYAATGNNYEVPASVEQCVTSNRGNETRQKACIDAVPGNWDNSILALRMDDGHLAWGRRMTYFDIWTLACFVPSAVGCPIPESPDYDFGQGPLYLPRVKCPSGTRDILVAAAKSGLAYGLDAANPEAGGDAAFRVSWITPTGAGSTSGGSQWGSAYDGKRTVFLQNANFASSNVTLTNPARDSTKWTTFGFATAIDVCDGSIIWQAASPVNASLMGAPTYAGVGQLGGSGYVFYPSTSAEGHIPVFKASTGQLHALLVAGPGSIVSGPSIVNDMLYVGAGYARFGLGIAGSNVRAFNLTSTI